MGLTVFNQFPQLTRRLARIARTAAHKETARPFVRINLIGGCVSLTDRAVNLVALNGDAATFTETSPIRNPGRQTDLLILTRRTMYVFPPITTHQLPLNTSSRPADRR